MLKIVALILGLVIAAWGGVIAYRALFLEPTTTAVVNTGTGEVHEYPSMIHVATGLVMLAGGAAISFFAARHKPL